MTAYQLAFVLWIPLSAVMACGVLSEIDKSGKELKDLKSHGPVYGHWDYINDKGKVTHSFPGWPTQEPSISLLVSAGTIDMNS